MEFVDSMVMTAKKDRGREKCWVTSQQGLSQHLSADMGIRNMREMAERNQKIDWIHMFIY